VISRLKTIIFFSFCATLAFRGVAQPTQSPSQPVNVVASFSVLSDLVRQVGGERVEIHSLVGWGEDAHLFQPKSSDILNIAHADLLVSNGLGFEGWLDRLLQVSKFQGRELVASKGVDVVHTRNSKLHDEHHAEAHDSHYGRVDPHAWLSISAVKVYVRNIATMLGEIDASHRAFYQVNARQYLKRLDALDDYAKTHLLGLPEAKRHIVVPHNSFAYLAREYGFQVHSLQGLSTEAQASAAQVARVIRQIRRLQISAVFSENIVNSRLIDQVKNETGVRIAGKLISGALSNDVAPTYLKMMEHNINMIVQAQKPD